MQYSVNFFAYQCSVTGRGFNTGFFIDGVPFGSVEQALVQIKSLGLGSFENALVNERLCLVSAHKHEDMKYIQYENEESLVELAGLGVSLEQMKVLLPWSKQYSNANAPDLAAPKSNLYSMTEAEVLAEYKKRGIEIDPDEVTDSWISDCCKCSVSGELLLHDDEVYTNVLTGLPLSDGCSFTSPDGVYWYA